MACVLVRDLSQLTTQKFSTMVTVSSGSKSKSPFARSEGPRVLKAKMASGTVTAIDVSPAKLKTGVLVIVTACPLMVMLWTETPAPCVLLYSKPLI